MRRFFQIFLVKGSLILLLGLLNSCSYLQGINIIAKNQPSQTQQYLQGSDDIPIMAEMTKISNDENSLGFDTASGSIITSSYSTNLSLQQIASFYNQTLPQMGWQATEKMKNALNFKRDKQNLAIEFFKKNPINIVRFFVTNQV